jgi:crotonobetainyl-CoA:carnitine CoA-transferase CaiB-like acyl-CoA transferase
MQNRATLEAEIEAVLATATSDHWVEVLEAAGVPCGAPPRPRAIREPPGFGRSPHIRTQSKIGDDVRVRTVAPSSANTTLRSSAGSA